MPYENAIDAAAKTSASSINLRLFALTGGFITLFCLLALFNDEVLGTLVDAGFAWSAQFFGLYWQVLLLANFLIGLAVVLHPGGGSIIGGLNTPEFSRFQWAAMIMCTLLAGGGVFWAAGEPMAHYLRVPPAFPDIAAGSSDAVTYALAQSYLHWGFLAWAILGSLTTIMLMHYHYDRGLPLAPRTLLYPVFGERALRGFIGDLADSACIIAVVAGTVGPIGFLGLQVSYGLETLFSVPDTATTRVGVIGVLMAIYLTSAVTGVSRGIQWLSRANIILGGALLIYLFIVGPTQFIVSEFATGLATHVEHFFTMALYRGDADWFGPAGWLGSWTVFFWAWFIGYGPLMAIFIARVSRGRSIRSIVIMLSIIAPLVTMGWFTILGGTGLGLEQDRPGVVSDAMAGFNLPAALLAITQAMPLGFTVSVLFLLLTTIFVATTGDSMTYSIAASTAQSSHPPTLLRVFWGVALGLMAIVLISIGGGGIGQLQNFIVITAVPVSVILLPPLWDALRITRERSTTG